MVNFAAFLVIHPVFGLRLNRRTLEFSGNTEGLSIALGVIWLVTMAILYQVERSVEKRLAAIAVAEASKGKSMNKPLA